MATTTNTNTCKSNPSVATVAAVIEEFDCTPEEQYAFNLANQPSRRNNPRTPLPLTQPFYQDNPHIFEIGADEAGRGPLFGRVYSAAAVLPRNSPDFNYALMKDSKKFTSDKKIQEAAEHIKQHAVAWSVKWANEKVIDKMNILQATQHAMHEAIRDVCAQLGRLPPLLINPENTAAADAILNQEPNILLLIDGNYFNPLTVYNACSGKFSALPFHMIEHGDALYACIAAASILAKVERDKYVLEMCEQHPELNERYGLAKNKGYGTKQHVEGIKKWGYSEWHRRSFHLKQLEGCGSGGQPVNWQSTPARPKKMTIAIPTQLIDDDDGCECDPGYFNTCSRSSNSNNNSNNVGIVSSSDAGIPLNQYGLTMFYLSSFHEASLREQQQHHHKTTNKN